MKRLVTLMVMLLTIVMAYGQKNVRQTASNYLKAGKLDKALEAINQCITEPTTAEDSRTWFIRGNIYLEIANSTDQNYRALDPDALTKSLESYEKAFKFDPKKEFYEDIFAKLNWERNNLYNMAVDAYNKQDYHAAMKNFADAASVIDISGLADTVAILNAAYCATLANDPASAKKYYLTLLNKNYKSPGIYTSISDIYRAEGDKENALNYIQQGKEMYPGDPQIFLAETSVFLTFNLTDKALTNLLTYIQTDTTNYSVYFALGTIYDRIVNDSSSGDATRKDALEKAIGAYDQSLKLNPEYFNALYNIGALYVNCAAVLEVQANALPLDKVDEYDQLKAELNEYLKKAAPYLEQAIIMQPNDVATLQTLRMIYSRTGQNEKLKDINAKIDSLTK